MQTKLAGSWVKVYQGGTLVPITTPGTGRLTLDIRRVMTVQPSTSIYAPACLYETGDKISVRAAENDVLPNGLVAGTTYYVRKVDADEFELYNTLSNAQNLSSTTGRVEYLTSGNKTTSTFLVDNIQGPVLVKTVSHIEKPKTDGYVSLYAFDYGGRKWVDFARPKARPAQRLPCNVDCADTVTDACVTHPCLAADCKHRCFSRFLFLEELHQ